MQTAESLPALLPNDHIGEADDAGADDRAAALRFAALRAFFVAAPSPGGTPSLAPLPSLPPRRIKGVPRGGVPIPVRSGDGVTPEKEGELGLVFWGASGL